MKKILFTALIFLAATTAITFAKTEPPASKLAGFKQELAGEKNPTTRFHLREKIAKFYSSEPITKANAPEAKANAEALLKESVKFKTNWNYGNAIHHANTVLGRVSLVMGDYIKAKQYLQASAKTPGSPQLKNFGPNMTLAKEILIHKGEKQPVVAYIDATLVFWKSQSAKTKTEAWKKSIAKGKLPEFKANLKF